MTGFEAEWDEEAPSPLFPTGKTNIYIWKPKYENGTKIKNIFRKYADQ